jgi:hypothetical protein
VPAIANAHAGTIFLDGKSFGKIYFEGGPQKEKVIRKKECWQLFSRHVHDAYIFCLTGGKESKLISFGSDTTSYQKVKGDGKYWQAWQR